MKPSNMALAWACAAMLAACHKPQIDYPDGSPSAAPPESTTQMVPEVDQTPVSDAPAASASDDASLAAVESSTNEALAAEGKVAVDVGAGIKVPLGISIDLIKIAHRDANCFPFRDDKMCEIAQPEAPECPGGDVCGDLVYSFKDGVLTGFMAKYEEAAWDSLRTQAINKLGEPRVKHNPAIAGMASDMSIWETGKGELTFVHFTGTDVYGRPLAAPYTIGFGPPANGG